MAEKRVSVRLAAVGGRQVRAELEGVGEAGAKGLGRLSREMELANTRLASFARRAGLALGAAAAAATASLGLIVRSTAESAAQIRQFAQVANATPEALQRWSAGARTVGIEQEKLADILKDVNDRVGDFLQTGGGPMADFFENVAPRVGVTADQFARLSGPEALQLYVDTLERAGLSQQEMTFYLEAMASDATRLLPLLRNGGTEMARLGDQASDLGAVLDGDALEALRRTQLALGTVSLVFEGLRNRIAVAVAPTIEALANAFVALASDGGTLRSAIDGLIGNLGRLASYAATFAAVMAGRWVAGMAAAALSVRGLATALVFLRGALIRTGIGALIVGAGELVYGNRLPQLSFEVFRPLADPDTAEGLVKAVTMIPASGEFTYATEAVRKTVGATTTVFGQTTGGTTSAENLNALPDEADIVVALDRLQAMAPAVESVSLVVAWFGNDLRVGNCTIKPGVEVATKVTSPKVWSVNGVARANAHLVSRDAEDRPVYGGTPADFAVVQAIREMKARGLRVTFYPFLLMDVPPGNTLPNPYSNNAATPGQPSFPWRGRITCSPAPGYAGTADKTAAAATQVASFFGAATWAQFAVSGDTVAWTGPSGDWGLRRMILHYAHLCAVAGGVDAFLIGTEMRGLTTIRSSSSAYPAVTAFKALAADVKAILGPGTKVGYASDWSEYFGHQPGDGSGDVYFHLDPLWSDANIDFIGIDNYMPLSDWRDGFDHADALEGWPAIHDRGYLQANIAGGEGFDWFYTSAADRSAQLRTPITDGSAGKPWVFSYKHLRAWWSNPHFNRPGGVESGTPTSWVPQSKPVWFTELGCPAIDRGTNQPNVFFDPKSSESFTPYFSRGWRDDAIQRAYLEASYLWWGHGANNPTSSVYGGRMVHVPECAAWTWDARPYPFFPELTGIWTDGPNWRLGHWLTGRLGAVSLAALARHLCLRAGLAESLIDVAGLWGAVEGYVIGAIESPRASISTLARHFGFDAIETEGVIRFVMRGRASSLTLSVDDLVSSREGEAFELTRGQETELPQALKWQVARADEDYDAALVEARRITVDTTRIASESFPMAIPPEEAERRCRRALMEAWIGRESATFRLPPSRLALDPADVIRLAHDGREVEFRLVSVADSEARGIEVVRQDRAAYDLPPGDPRPASLASPVVFGTPEVVMLDLPQISEDQPAHRPLIAAHASPWPGEIAVFRSASTDGFNLLTTFDSRARIGTLAFDFFPGPTSRFDLGNALVVDLLSGTLESVTDVALFGGANALAVEAAAGQWEIVQAGATELIAPGRYRLTRLLRGQRGTEHAMGNPAPAGARVVLLDATLASLPIAEADLGLPWNWRVGPAARVVSDASYAALGFTPTGRGLVPFAPVHVEQPWRTAGSPGDLTIRWTRRSPALVADAWEQVEVPLAEDVEGYDIQILDGASVKRTLSSSTTSTLYTAAQQTADWGAPLGPGQTLAIRIFQLSNRLGRGTPATVILQF